MENTTMISCNELSYVPKHTTPEELIKMSEPDALVCIPFDTKRRNFPLFTPYQPDEIADTFSVYILYGKVICVGYENLPGRVANHIRDYYNKALIYENLAMNYDRCFLKLCELLEPLTEVFCKQA